MKLIVKDDKKLSEVCPYGGEEVVLCRHCKNPPCNKSKGIVRLPGEIYTSKGGSPQDTSLCPYGALKWVWRLNSLVKCNLCFSEGYPRCVEAGVVEIEYDEEDMEEIGKAVGWLVHGTAEYNIKILPVLPHEARIYRKIIEVYAKNRGEFSLEEIIDYIVKEYDLSKKLRERLLWIHKISSSPTGPLSLINDPNVEEITVVGIKRPVKVYIRGEGWKDTNIFIWTEEYFMEMVNRAGEIIGKRLTSADPRLNAVFPDGSRIHAVTPPVSDVHSLTVRRFSVEPLTPSHLIDSGFPPEVMAVLWIAMEREKNVLIAGNTGSGKTTLLNAIFGFVPLEERIIIVEEVPEIRLPHPHVVRLTPRGNIDMNVLVKDTLRMRPDRVIVGEVRNEEEVRAFADTVLSGQGRGSYATFHGRSLREVKARLTSLGFREVDLPSIDVVVVMRRRGGKKVTREVKEVGSFGGELLDVLESDSSELSERAKILKNEKVYTLYKFVKKFSSWT